VARQEVDFMAGLCAAHEVGTLLAIERCDRRRWRIRERFRVVGRDKVPDEGDARHGRG
jgi:hypothetical protein